MPPLVLWNSIEFGFGDLSAPWSFLDWVSGGGGAVLEAGGGGGHTFAC